MADPALALNLLMARDAQEAARLAASLEEINQERRSIEAELTEQAEAIAERTYDGGRVIVVGGEGWHEGVKGIVASRLVNRYHVPTLLFSIEDGVARGSGRSVGAVNLFEAVEKCSDLLIRFGGHAGAVGVTCAAENLDALRERLGAVLAELPAEDFEDRGEVAATVRLSELDIDTIRQIGMLEPFGQGQQGAVARRLRRHDVRSRRCGQDGRPHALCGNRWGVERARHHVPCARGGRAGQLRHRSRPGLRGGRRVLAGTGQAQAHDQGHSASLR